MNKIKLVKFNYNDMPNEYHKLYPFIENKIYAILGEISNMDGHGLISDINGNNIYGIYDLDNFVEFNETEL